MGRIIKTIKKIILWLLFLISAILLAGYMTMVYREQQSLETAAPTSGKLIQTNDARIFVQDSGPRDGAAIVLIHGTGAWSEIWRDTITPLTNFGFRVVALDLPPFGYSEKLTGAAAYQSTKQAQRIADVLKALYIPKAIMVCHSVRCRSAIELVLRQPETIEKLVMADPALSFDENSNPPNFKQNTPAILPSILLAPHPLRTAIIATYGSNPLSIKPIFSSFVYDKSCVTPERVSILQKPLVIKNMTQAEGDWLQNLSLAADDSLYTDFNNFSKLTMPVLLIWGREDTITPLWQGEKLNTLFPNANLVVIDKVGHIPYIEDTERFNDELLKFVN